MSDNIEEKAESFFQKVWNWVKARWSERTTWDGIIMIGAGVAYLVLEPIAGIVAWAVIAFGAWRVFQKEIKPRLKPSNR